MAFDWNSPTVQLLGRWQPWHDGHLELFKRAHAETGQVCIMIRSVPEDTEANERVPGQDDNPFELSMVVARILESLKNAGFIHGEDYIVMPVPNIVDISYGRGVGYTFTEHRLSDDITQISGTKIRAEMRKSGELPPK